MSLVGRRDTGSHRGKFRMLIIESFRLEKTHKIKSNSKPNTSKSTTEPCP